VGKELLWPAAGRLQYALLQCAKATSRQVSIAPSPIRRSDSTPTARFPPCGSRLYASKTAQDHIQTEDTHGGRRERSWDLSHLRPQCVRLFNISPGPPVGVPLSVHAPLEHIKGRARTLERGGSHSRRVSSSSPKLTNNTSHSGRRVLCSGGLNHSKPVYASRVHTHLDRAFLDYPQTHPKLGLGGCIPPPGWRNPPTVCLQQDKCNWSGGSFATIYICCKFYVSIQLSHNNALTHMHAQILKRSSLLFLTSASYVSLSSSVFALV
jgi:hypothetical protein